MVNQPFKKTYVSDEPTNLQQPMIEHLFVPIPLPPPTPSSSPTLPLSPSSSDSCPPSSKRKKSKETQKEETQKEDGSHGATSPHESFQHATEEVADAALLELSGVNLHPPVDEPPSLKTQVASSFKNLLTDFLPGSVKEGFQEGFDFCTNPSSTYLQKYWKKFKNFVLNFDFIDGINTGIDMLLGAIISNFKYSSSDYHLIKQSMVEILLLFLSLLIAYNIFYISYYFSPPGPKTEHFKYISLLQKALTAMKDPNTSMTSYVGWVLFFYILSPFFFLWESFNKVFYNYLPNFISQSVESLVAGGLIPKEFKRRYMFLFILFVSFAISQHMLPTVYEEFRKNMKESYDMNPFGGNKSAMFTTGLSFIVVFYMSFLLYSLVSTFKLAIMNVVGAVLVILVSFFYIWYLGSTTNLSMILFALFFFYSTLFVIVVESGGVGFFTEMKKVEEFINTDGEGNTWETVPGTDTYRIVKRVAKEAIAKMPSDSKEVLHSGLNQVKRTSGFALDRAANATNALVHNVTTGPASVANVAKWMNNLKRGGMTGGMTGGGISEGGKFFGLLERAMSEKKGLGDLGNIAKNISGIPGIPGIPGTSPHAGNEDTPPPKPFSCNDSNDNEEHNEPSEGTKILRQILCFVHKLYSHYFLIALFFVLLNQVISYFLQIENISLMLFVVLSCIFVMIGIAGYIFYDMFFKTAAKAVVIHP